MTVLLSASARVCWIISLKTKLPSEPRILQSVGSQALFPFPPSSSREEKERAPGTEVISDNTVEFSVW